MGIFDRIRPQDLLGRPEVVSTSPATTEISRDPLNRADLARLDRIREGLAAFRHDTSTPAAVGVLLDKTIAEWLAIPQKRRPDPDASVKIFGVAIGDHLCTLLGGHWITCVFEDGSELAVEVDEGGPLLFPIARVSAQWGARADWVGDYMAQSAREIAAYRSGPAEPVPSEPVPAEPVPAVAVPAVPSQASGSSAQVDALAKRALDRAMVLVAPGGPDLVPFTLVEDSTGAVEITQFAGEALEALELARRHVRHSTAVRAAVGWHGALSVSGQRSSAVLVEASARGESSLLVAQRHQDGQAIGPPQLVGRQAPLL